MASSNHARDYERFWDLTEKAALKEKSDPTGYHKLKLRGIRFSDATNERIRIAIRDLNDIPWYKEKKIRNRDQLINLLLDNLFGNSVTSDGARDISIHTEAVKVKNFQIGKHRGD